MLLYVAVCCCALLCVAVCCIVLIFVAGWRIEDTPLKVEKANQKFCLHMVALPGVCFCLFNILLLFALSPYICSTFSQLSSALLLRQVVSFSYTQALLQGREKTIVSFRQKNIRCNTDVYMYTCT